MPIAGFPWNRERESSIPTAGSISSILTTPSFASVHDPLSALRKYSECFKSSALWTLNFLSSGPTLSVTMLDPVASLYKLA